MDREKDAAGLYLKFAAAVSDLKAKNVLIHLAKDEVGHLDRLERHLVRAIAGKGKERLQAAADLADAMAARLDEGPPLTIPSASELVRADEIRILDLALQLELEANRRYIDLAASAAPGEGKEIFLSLAKEEETHAKILRAEIDSIGQNGFWFDIQEFTMEQ
jgi:rubrerythrin